MDTSNTDFKFYLVRLLMTDHADGYKITNLNLPALIDLLPEPCAVIDRGGKLSAVNAQWRDVFINTGLDSDLIAACLALFQWDDDAWAVVEAELRLLLAGALDRVTFEAQITEPPDRWVSSSLALCPPTGGCIWQLTLVTRWQMAEAETLLVYEQFRDAVDSVPSGFALYDVNDRLVLYNRRYRELYALISPALVLGRTFEDAVRSGALLGQYPEATGHIDVFVAQIVAQHHDLSTTEYQLSSGRWIRVVNQRTSAGGIVSIHNDISDEREAMELRRQRDLQQEMIRAQEALLTELSTPVLRISENSLLMPLIGALDSDRTRRMVESLLRSVETQRARTVILDITGVQLVDTQVANVLIQCAQTVRMLGARLVLTGIRPDVAQTMVSLGIDLGSIITKAELRDGIAYALSAR